VVIFNQKPLFLIKQAMNRLIKQRDIINDELQNLKEGLELLAKLFFRGSYEGCR